MGYENAARINASAYKVFNEDLPNPVTSTAGYSHNLTTWPGSVSTWDFSGVPLCRSQSGILPATWTGALITPRHLLIAHHVIADWAVNDEVTFKNRAGADVVRTVTARSGDLGNDLALLTLNSAVTGCATYRIPTAASASTLVGSTIWCLDRRRRIITRTVSIVGNSITHTTDSSGGTLLDASNGSGQPSFLSRGDGLVLLGTHFGATVFPNAANYLSELQAFCDTTSQTIQTVSVDPASWVQPLAAAL